MQLHVNQDGKVITPEGMAEIETRHERKEALLAEMRADREAQYAQRHSHVGVEIGLDIKDIETLAMTYHSLAAMANYCALGGHDVAGRTLASLANGIKRAAVQMYGKEAEAEVDRLAGITIKDMRRATLKPLDITAEPEAIIPTEASTVLTDATGEVFADDIAAIIRGEGQGYSGSAASADDEREPGSALQEATSPEPDATDLQYQRAQARRAARLAAKQGKAKS